MSPSPALSTAPSTPSWRPLTRRRINPEAQEVARMVGDEMHEVWANDIYECQVRYLNGSRREALHLSVKRLDREPVRDWRHLQSIKNEVAGPEREAVELYPAESRLVDNANQFHLWVMPEGTALPVGFRERAVYRPEEIRAQMARQGIPDNGKAKQRPFQPGLSTGPEFGRKVGM